MSGRPADGDDTLDDTMNGSIRSQVTRQLQAAVRPDGSIDLDGLSDLVTASLEGALVAGRAQATRLQAVLDNMAQGVCLFDGEQKLIVSNNRFAEIYKLHADDVRPGAALRRIVERRYLEGSAPAMTPSEYLRWRDRIEETQQSHSSVVELQDGRTIAIRHQPMAGGGWVATHEDISDRIKIERQLDYLARYDPETGLPNRATLVENLRDVLERTSRVSPCATLSLSLDGLQSINETLGRAMGDELLRVVAAQLRLNLHPGDIIGLQASNEFMIIQRGTNQPGGATHLAEQLLRVVNNVASVAGHQVAVTASIGISIAFEACSSPELMVKNSLIALSRAKMVGRGRFCLFDPEMDRIVQAGHLLEKDLREAVKEFAFQLYYQPQIELRTGFVNGFEALLRWNHPVRGFVPPAEFIPIAEDIDLIGDIGRWVLEHACLEALSWPETITVAVNVSASQLRDGSLASIVAGVLRQTGLRPGRLVLEITETCMVENAAVASAVLAELRAIGVRVAMDDFGTGYSSLGTLPTLPFDKIKIDRSFIWKLDTGGAHTAIVRTIIDLCASLNVDCVAEGVETTNQLQILRSFNCTEVQGYLFGRPGPAGHIPKLLMEDAANGTKYWLKRATDPPGEPSHVEDDTPAISFADVVETANDVIIITDANLDPPGPTILYVNSAFTRLTGFEKHEAIGLSPRILQGIGTSRATLDEIDSSLRAGAEVRQKVLNYSKTGAPYWLDLRIVPIRNTSGRIIQFAAIERDVTLEKRRFDELQYVSDRDTLTGIPNRRALLRNMDAELQACRLRPGAGPCLAIIDIDNFKGINDEYGHATGDAILLEIADRLANNIRRVDMLGRIGGDEFAVWMPAASLSEAATILERLRAAVASTAFDTAVGSVKVSISVGVSEAGATEQNLAALMHRADRAMYAAKQSGRDKVATEAIPLG